MSKILIIILVLVVLITLVQRFLVSVLGVPERKSKRGSNDIANYMVKDPVCGMYMDSRLALQIEKRGTILYFCSEQCRKKYLESGETKVPVSGSKAETGRPEST